MNVQRKFIEENEAIIRTAIDFGWEHGFSGSPAPFGGGNTKAEEKELMDSFFKHLRKLPVPE